MTTMVDILRAARAEIALNGWFRGPGIGHPNTEYLPLPGREKANCNCLATAVMNVTKYDPGNVIQKRALEYIWRALGSPATANFDRFDIVTEINDSKSLEEGYTWSLGIFDAAIALAQADEAQPEVV